MTSIPPAATDATAMAATEAPTWTGRFRARAESSFPPEKLLPDRQPAYVASWIYVFGALTLGAFGVVLLSGAVIAIEGPAWWHTSRVGLYVNSTHLWSTELFFFFMVIHLWGKFFMAAWRGRRRATWITGLLAFVISIATAFTGYLSQQNFSSEWIGVSAKDGINATGAGAFWNVLNFGQMLLWHVLLLPIVVAVVIAFHVLLVRRRGVVPPFAIATTAAGARYESAPPPAVMATGAGAEYESAPPSGIPTTEAGAPYEARRDFAPPPASSPASPAPGDPAPAALPSEEAT